MQGAKYWMFAALTALALLPSLASAMPEVEVRMLARGLAVLEIDGQQHRLKAGEESPEGVRLIDSDSKQATIEYQGERHRLGINRRIASQYEAPSRDKPRVHIPADSAGHYVTRGEINGQSVRFMVDTGATEVVIGGQQARHLGIPFDGGEEIMAMTASGVAAGNRVTLDSVSVGPLEVAPVSAVVLEDHTMETILLGNSFLRAVEMNTAGDNLVLIAR